MSTNKDNDKNKKSTNNSRWVNNNSGKFGSSSWFGKKPEDESKKQDEEKNEQNTVSEESEPSQDTPSDSSDETEESEDTTNTTDTSDNNFEIFTDDDSDEEPPKKKPKSNSESRAIQPSKKGPLWRPRNSLPPLPPLFPKKKRNTLNNFSSFDDLFKDLLGPIPSNPSAPLLPKEEPCPNPECDHLEDLTGNDGDMGLHLTNGVKNISDLIELGKMYHCKKCKKCNDIDMKVLYKLIKPLEKLQNMVGMTSVKEAIVGHIVYFLQGLQEGQDDMLHTVIEGPPGVGKTELGKILGELYFCMGILKHDDDSLNANGEFDLEKKFKIVKRSDLVGKFLGHTAAKTQEVIDECQGGVMFIDEAYSLGNAEGRDSFSKECIDTINQNLTEKKNNFLCIIAGYADSLEKCFFAYNEGLRRRFPFRYSIEAYTPDELMEIFLMMISKLGWEMHIEEKDALNEFFHENGDCFPHFGGDMETLLLNCKISHGERVFCLPSYCKRVITMKDVEAGFAKYKKSSKVQQEVEKDDRWKHLYT